MRSSRGGRGSQLKDALIRAGLAPGRRSTSQGAAAATPQETVPVTARPQPAKPGPAVVPQPVVVRQGRQSTSPVVRPSPVIPPVILRRTGPFRPHPAFGSGAGSVSRLRPAKNGIAPDLTVRATDVQDEVDLVLGLDFGTSSIKAVIRDHLADRAFAVRFTDSAENAYLLPSRVWLTNGAYSLDGGVEVRRDLKLGLLGSGVESPVDEFNDACAFLALVIRHCRGWLLDTHVSEYRRKRINWSINLGLPARSYEDDRLVRLFRRLAWAAGNVGADGSERVSRDLCDTYRQRSKEIYLARTEAPVSQLEFGPEDVDVVPEIAAQIFGLVSVANWDWRNRPMMMLVDIGAGTVDTAFFSFTRATGQPRFAFYASDVQPNGVMNLHRARVNWLLAASGEHASDPDIQKYLHAIRFPTDLNSVPDTVHEYMSGFEISVPPGQPDIDTGFYRSKFHPQVAACPQQARRNGRIPDAQLQAVPCFLAGGGSRMPLYGKVIEDVNALPRIIRLEKMRMALPRAGLVCRDLRESDMDRLSVAYGLSHHGAGGRPLGKVVRTIEIPRDEDSERRSNWRDNYIDEP